MIGPEQRPHGRLRVFGGHPRAPNYFLILERDKVPDIFQDFEYPPMVAAEQSAGRLVVDIPYRRLVYHHFLFRLAAIDHVRFELQRAFDEQQGVMLDQGRAPLRQSVINQNAAATEPAP